MNRNGLFWHFFRGKNLSGQASNYRAKALTQATDEKADFEAETAWVAGFSRDFIQTMQTFCGESGKSEEKALQISEWSAPFYAELEARSDVRELYNDVKNAEESLLKLEGILRRRITNRPGHSDRFGLAFADSSLNDSFKHIQSIIHDLREQLPRNATVGNIPTNKGVCIEMVWPVLRDAGHSMKHSAKIMTKAFERAKLESGDCRKRQQSIYQAIRNMEVR